MIYSSELIAKKYKVPDGNSEEIVLGGYPLMRDEEMVLTTTNRYYDWVEDLVKSTQRELDSAERIIDGAFKNKIIKKLKLQFFPRFQDLEKLYYKGDYRPNENLSELSYWPQNEISKERVVKNYKFSYELYLDLLRSKIVPKRLKQLLNRTIPVSLTAKDIQNHAFIVARTDTGKSTLLLELAKNIIDKQEGNIVLIEPHGDLSNDLARLVNPNDLIYIDPFLDANYSVTINIFDMKEVTQENLSKYGGLILNTFKQIIGSEFSVSMHSLLNPMIAVLLQIPNTSFYDMLRFLNDKENHDLLEYAKEHALIPSHRLFFKNQFSESRYSITKFSIASKLNILLQDSIFSNMLTGKSTIDLQNIMDTPGKVIIIRLNTIKMMETIKPIGRFIIALLVSYAFQRENIPQQQRIATHLMIDEASMFLGDSIELILAQARKFRLYLLMATQNNSQLPTSIESSILSNTAIKFVGMNSHKNHKIMSKELNISMDALFSLRKKGEFFIKVGNERAKKFRVSNRLFNRSLYATYYEFNKTKQQQKDKYYRIINLSNIEYAQIPNNKDVATHTAYSKNATQELLVNLSNNNDEILDY